MAMICLGEADCLSKNVQRYMLLVLALYAACVGT